MVCSLLSPSVSLHLSLVLAHFLWQGLLLGLLAAVAAGLLRRASAQSRYLVHLGLLGLMFLCLPVTSLVLQQCDERSLPSETVRLALDTPPSPFDAPLNMPQAALSPGDVPPPPLLANGRAELPPVSAAPRWQIFAPYLTLVYLLGVVVMLLRFAWGLAAGHRMRRDREPVHDPDLLELVARQARQLGLRFVPAVAYCRRIAVPALVGVVRPMILLPVALANNLSPAEIEAILTHELAHLRRYDPLVNCLQRIIEAVLFFHPAVWYVSRQVSREREHCCDDLVLAAGETPLAYAQSLLRIAELSLRASKSPAPRWSSMLHSTGDRPSQLRGRILRLLGDGEDSRVRLSRSGLWTLGLLLVAVTLLGVGVVRSAAVAHPDDNPGEATLLAESTGTADSLISRDKLVVQIRATDAGTGQPILPVMVIPGTADTFRPTDWHSQYRKSLSTHPAEYRYLRRGHSTVLRIAAEGYQPFITEPLVSEGKTIALDVPLKPDPGITGTVLLPDGRPASGAKLAVNTTAKWAKLHDNGKLIYYSPFSGQELPVVTSGEDGSFHLPPEADLWQLMIVHESGYAETSPEELAQSVTITLKPWGRVEGELAPQGKPLESQSISIRRNHEPDQPFSEMDSSYEARTTTDSEGKFVFEKVPPINVSVDHPFRHPDLKGCYPCWCTSELRVPPGETTQVLLPVPGRPVTGRIVLPAASERQGTDLTWKTSIVLRPPADEERTGIPEFRKAYEHFLESEIGQAYRRDSVSIQDDGTFCLKGLPQGNYVLRITARTKSTSPQPNDSKQVGSLVREFAVPPQAGSADPFDLGESVLGEVTRNASSQEATPVPTIPVSGQVIDEQGQPVAGAHLVLAVKGNHVVSYGSKESFTLAGRSDAQGRFRFEVPSVWLPPYTLPGASLWVWAEGKQVAIDFGITKLLGKPTPASEIRVVLAPAATAEFSVVDPAGQPVPGATLEPVVLQFRPQTVGFVPQSLAANLRATTDPEGRARFNGISRENLQGVAVTTEQFGRQVFYGMQGRTTTLQLVPAGRLEGRVTAADAALVRGIPVTVASSAASPVHEPGRCNRGEAAVVTDDQGRFVVPAIPSGMVSVRVQAPSPYLPSPSRPTKSKLEPSGTCQVEIPLIRGVPVTGTVRALDSHRPLTRAHLLITGNPESVVTDALGRFSSWVLPGQVEATVQDAPAPYVANRTKVEVQVAADAQAFELPPLDVPLSQSIPGSLFDAQDQSVANCRVVAQHIKNAYEATGTIIADGQFVLSGVPAGADLWMANFYLYDENVPAVRPLSLVRTEPLVLSLEPQPVLRGTVLGPLGKPVVGARIELVPIPWRLLSPKFPPGWRYSDTDANGTFRVPASVEGSFSAIVITQPEQHLAGYFPHTAHYQKGQRTTTFNATLRRSGRVTGQVLVDGKARPNVPVQLRANESDDNPWAKLDDFHIPFATVLTDHAGRFVFETVPTGVSLGVSSQGLGQPQPIVVQPGQTLEVQPLHVLEQAQSIAGTVVDSQGRPVPNAEIQVRLENPDLGELPYSRTHPVEKDGSFRVGFLPDLPIRVTAFVRTLANDPNYRILASADVDAQAGDENVRIVLDSK